MSDPKDRIHFPKDAAGSVKLRTGRHTEVVLPECRVFVEDEGQPAVPARGGSLYRLAETGQVVDSLEIGPDGSCPQVWASMAPGQTVRLFYRPKGTWTMSDLVGSAAFASAEVRIGPKLVLPYPRSLDLEFSELPKKGDATIELAADDGSYRSILRIQDARLRGERWSVRYYGVPRGIPMTLTWRDDRGNLRLFSHRLLDI